MHVAAYIRGLGKEFEKPTVKQHLAAIRMLFDWLVTGQVVATNPAHAVRGPKHVVKTGKTTVLTGEQARELLDSIDVTTLVGLRDRALIAVMTFAFARIGAVVAMRVEDYFPKGKRWWVRLHEKGGKRHEMPAHHNLEAYLDAYIEAAKIRDAGKAPLFRSAVGRTGVLTENADAPRRRLAHGPAPRRRSRDARADWVPYVSRARGSPPISKPAARSKTRRPWRRTKARARRSSMIAPAMRLRSMRLFCGRTPILKTPEVQNEHQRILQLPERSRKVPQPTHNTTMWAGSAFCLSASRIATTSSDPAKRGPLRHIRNRSVMQVGPAYYGDTCNQVMVCPPLAESVDPVMKPASSAARNTTQRAISSGWPRRRTGICGRIDFSSTSLGTAITISVAI